MNRAEYQSAVNQVLGDTLIRERQLVSNMQELENETQIQLDSISSDNVRLHSRAIGSVRDSSILLFAA